MIKIEGLSKFFRTEEVETIALNNVSLEVKDGEFVAIMGPSGCGKSTLLNILGLLDNPTSGDYYLAGKEVGHLKEKERTQVRKGNIGFVFQSYNLIPHQTILSNVELALTISGVSHSERRERARKALEQVGLGEHVNKKPNQLSGGQMQRVAIARALVNDPDIVLADEPTGALDSDTSVQIMDLLKEVAKDRLVVMVTHNPELAYQYATRIVELKDGVIRSDSDPFEPAQNETATASVHKTMGRVSMSFGTSLALSFNNLRTKKGRTFLTAFAGSIGIIGIALIMSVSAGVNTYIDNIQRETMTAYPISIDEQTFDLTSMMTSGQQSADNQGKKHKSDAIYPDDAAIKGTASMTSSITENNLSAFKKYLDNKDSDINRYIGSAGIQYSYDTRFSVFSHDPDGTLVNADGVTVGKTGTKSMADQMADGSLMSADSSTFTSTRVSMLTGKTDQNAAPSSFHEIMPSADGKKNVGKVISDNYEVVEGSWPKNKNEVVLVLDENNSLSLTAVYELGLKSASEYHDMMNQLNSGDDVKTDTKKIDYSDVIDRTLKLLPACDQYVKGDNGHWTYVGDDVDQINALIDSDKAIDLKIVGVVKPVEDADATPLSSGVGYTRALTNELIDRAESSEIVTEQRSDKDHNVLNGMTFSPSDDATKAQDARDYVASLGVSSKAQMAQNMKSAGVSDAAERIADLVLKLADRHAK